MLWPFVARMTRSALEPARRSRSGSGTISQLVVIDAGTAKSSSLTLRQADQTLTGGPSIAANVTAAIIADSVTTNGGAILLAAPTTLAAITLASGSGDQTFSGGITLAGDAAIMATGGGNVAVSGGVTLGNGGDTITFAGGVTSAAGPTTLAGTIVTTDASFGVVTLAADATLTAGGNVTFTGPVDGAHGLNVANAANVTFGGNVGQATPLADLTVTAPTGTIDASERTITAGGVAFNSTNQMVGSIETTGGVSGSADSGNLTLNATRFLFALRDLTSSRTIATGTGDAIFAPMADTFLQLTSRQPARSSASAAAGSCSRVARPARRSAPSP